VVRIALEPFFLHQEQVTALLGATRMNAALAEAARRPGPPEPMSYVLSSSLAKYLPDLNIAELQRSLNARQVQVGQMVGIQQEFYFCRAKERDRPGDKPIDFHAIISTDETVTVKGTFNSERLASASATGGLTGRKPAYIIGTVMQVTSDAIVLRPAFAGVRSFIEDDQFVAHAVPQDRRVYPSEVDQFSKAYEHSEVDAADIASLRSVPEELIKKSLASIVGEPFVPKDWGGERSDLYTTHISVQGKQVSSAWLLKGRGFPRPMTIAALGKRGDQIDRLYTEPADLLVLQHCHEIKTAVISMMETYAFDSRRPRRFMILDGTDTARILKWHGTLSA
jgi:hypothetical protein